MLLSVTGPETGTLNVLNNGLLSQVLCLLMVQELWGAHSSAGIWLRYLSL